ncbi:neurogenic locus notch homolog protein 3-like, partial [Saccostrea cucullata]|uniref:neurogenic locus notch homolog protein 3-like n=1 Tax=Saccostrea cuccullata TaxID=36930 RepID=UPI002ED4D314
TSCETNLDVCRSNPCFNGGTCVSNGNGFHCTCPSLSNCTMEAKPGSFVVADDKSTLTGKKSLDLCKQECLGDGQCKALYHTRGFCYIIRQDATPEQYTTDTASYFSKSCLYKYLYSGNQCETDLEDKCTPNTCSSHGMCQDRAGEHPVCLCPVVGEYSQPRCDLVRNLCDPNPCLHGAECRSWGAVRIQCICKPGYSGVDCSVDIGNLSKLR